MYNAAGLKIKSRFIFSHNPLCSHSGRPFSSCLGAALWGDQLKIEVFPAHVSELFLSVFKPSPPSLSLLLARNLPSL